MPVMRSSVVLGLGLILVTALSGSATMACLSCRDVAIHQSECNAEHGTFDESTCSCAGRSPDEPYPSSVPPRAVCTSDLQCRRACSEDGPCPLFATSCAYDDSCTCPGSGRCTMAECTGDLDCRAGSSCDVDTATCVPTCQAGAVCPGTTNYARCQVDADCRADEGASCVRGWCYGPNAGLRDAG